GRDFAFAAGLVLDAEIVHRVDHARKSARWNDAVFLFHGLRSFGTLRRSQEEPSLVIETPDGPQDAYWACLACSDPFTYFRSRPLRVVPDAGKADGLDVVAAKQVRFWRTLRWLTQALSNGHHVRHPECIHLTRRSEVTIRTRRPVPLQTDGEYLGEITRLRAFALPQALPVWG
ncbi:MAG: diacylglycerol/lipid kinase family protein, partial [Candidatus Binatia bacterium]